jgi:hypothetical protein
MGSWSSRMHHACTEHFAQKLAAWQGLAPVNRLRLATALCEDDRVFWPFADAQSQLTEMLEEQFRVRTPQGPMVLGLIGASPREVSEALHAVRDILFPSSKLLFRWTGDARPLRDWLARMDGGLMGGVVFTEVAANGSRAKTDLDLERANNAMELMKKQKLEGHVLVISVPADLHPNLDMVSNPIRWVNFEGPTAACEGRLSSKF